MDMFSHDYALRLDHAKSVLKRLTQPSKPKDLPTENTKKPSQIEIDNALAAVSDTAKYLREQGRAFHVLFGHDHV